MTPTYYCYYSNEYNAIDIPVVYGLMLLGYQVYFKDPSYPDLYPISFYIEAKGDKPDLTSSELDKKIKKEFPYIDIRKYVKDFNIKKVKLFEFTIYKAMPSTFRDYMENLKGIENEALCS